MSWRCTLKVEITTYNRRRVFFDALYPTSVYWALPWQQQRISRATSCAVRGLWSARNGLPTLDEIVFPPNFSQISDKKRCLCSFLHKNGWLSSFILVTWSNTSYECSYSPMKSPLSFRVKVAKMLKRWCAPSTMASSSIYVLPSPSLDPSVGSLDDGDRPLVPKRGAKRWCIKASAAAAEALKT